LEISDEERKKSLKEIEADIEKKYQLLLNLKNNSDIKIPNIQHEPKNEPIKKEIIKQEPIKEEIKNEIINKERKQEKPKKKIGIKRRYRKSKHIISDYVDDIKNKFDKIDLRGENVFLSDTGDKLGTVKDMIYDENNNLKALKIINEDKDTTVNFSENQFYYGGKGLIFTPKWYINADEDVKKFEFLDKTHPEYVDIISKNDFDEELFNIYLERDKEFSKNFSNAKNTYKMLKKQMEILEKKKEKLKEKTWDLTTNRLIEDLDRKSYSDEIKEIKRKANIYNINIKKYSDLIKRLENTSTGKISKYKQYNKESKNFLKEDENIDEILSKLLEKKINKEIKKYLIKSFESDEEE